MLHAILKSSGAARTSDQKSYLLYVPVNWLNQSGFNGNPPCHPCTRHSEPTLCPRSASGEKRVRSLNILLLGPRSAEKPD
jgi:hypothetical protein